MYPPCFARPAPMERVLPLYFLFVSKDAWWCWWRNRLESRTKQPIQVIFRTTSGGQRLAVFGKRWRINANLYRPINMAQMFFYREPNIFIFIVISPPAVADFFAGGKSGCSLESWANGCTWRNFASRKGRDFSVCESSSLSPKDYPQHFSRRQGRHMALHPIDTAFRTLVLLWTSSEGLIWKRSWWSGYFWRQRKDWMKPTLVSPV